MNWYPQSKEELTALLEKFIGKEKAKKGKEIHGLIVPHAGYSFSGEIAGKAFGLLKNRKTDTAVIMGPSHYLGFQGIRVMEKSETPLGKYEVIKNNFESTEYEHSIDNQVPFLQKLGFKKILPLAVGELENKEAEKIAEEISKIPAVYVFSTDLSHFLPYNQATDIDKRTIKIIENLDIKNHEKIDACGKFALLVMMHLCKLKGWKPNLLEYKNSGDIIGDKTGVVGYSSFWF